MIENQEQVLKWLGLSEGGEVNDPRDPGGHTNHGVTQGALNDYREGLGLGFMSVSHLTKSDADEIFVANYFRPIWFDQLPSGLDYAMGDFSVNSGASRPIKTLQKIVGVKVDGHLGVNTMAAISRFPAEDLVVKLCNARLAFMKRLSIWPTYKNGWTTRVMGNELGVQSGDIGVIDRGVRMATGRTSIPAPTEAVAGKAVETGGLLAVVLAILRSIFR